MDDRFLMGAILVAYAMIVATAIKLFGMKKNGGVTKEEFTEHKKTVQYKDNCNERAGRIEEKIDSTKELLENQFGNLDTKLGELKDLIKKRS